MKSFDLERITITGAKPQGRCIFVCCDYIYFSKFFEQLQLTIRKKFIDHDNIHCHVIANEQQQKIILKKQVPKDCTFSFENIDDVKIIINEKNYTYSDWKSIESIEVKKMLMQESARYSYLKKFLFYSLKFSPFILRLMPPITYINRTKLKTYYSLRRFLMPDYFFDKVTALLILDIDSVFNSEISFSKLIEEKSCALVRDDMWSKYLAGFVFFFFDKVGGSLSLSMLKELLLARLNKEGIHWGVDQLALDDLEKRQMIKPLISMKYSFKNEYDTGTVFVSLKGDSKWTL